MHFPRFYLFIMLFISSVATANGYPTIETVRYVLNCMAENGGQNEESLYACTCRFDVVSSALTFNEYETVSMYARNKNMTGEKGAIFRDSRRTTKELRNKYSEVQAQARNSCPLAIRVSRPVTSD